MKAKSDVIYVALQELAAVLLGLMMGLMLAFLCPHTVPWPVRYSIGLIIGWKWLASVPMYFVHRIEPKEHSK